MVLTDEVNSRMDWWQSLICLSTLHRLSECMSFRQSSLLGFGIEVADLHLVKVVRLKSRPSRILERRRRMQPKLVGGGYQRLGRMSCPGGCCEDSNAAYFSSFLSSKRIPTPVLFCGNRIYTLAIKHREIPWKRQRKVGARILQLIAQEQESSTIRPVSSHGGSGSSLGFDDQKWGLVVPFRFRQRIP